MHKTRSLMSIRKAMRWTFGATPLCGAALSLAFAGPVMARISTASPFHDPVGAVATQRAPHLGDGPGVDLPLSATAAARAGAIIAANRALSAENAPPTVFHAVVSLNDPDIAAQARQLSDKAGHDGLYYDYYRFRAAIDKVRRTKADKLDIPNGTYRLYPPADFPSGLGVLQLGGLSHVVIDGHGSTLLFYYIGKGSAPLQAIHPRAGIRIAGSDHLVLKDLVLDWDEPLAVPVTIGTPGQPGLPQTLTVDRHFPIDPAAPMGITVFLPFNFGTRLYPTSLEMDPADLAAWKAQRAPGGAFPYLCPSPGGGIPPSTCFRYVGGQTYAFGPHETLRPMPPHPANFLATVRDNNFGAVIVDAGSSFLTISGLTIYSSPGQGIALVGAGPAVHITHCRIVRKPDSLLRVGEQRRFISTLSDGMDVISSAGDVVIEDSEVANQADDGLNVYAVFRKAQATAANVLQAKAMGEGYYRVGSVVSVFDQKGGRLVAQSVAIAQVAQTGSDRKQVSITLQAVAPPLQPGSNYLISREEFGSSQVVVRNNWFHDSAERGVVVHGRNIAIVGNRIERTAESGVQALYDDRSGQPEGAPVDNLVIAGNLIRDVNMEWFDPSLRSVAVSAGIGVLFASRVGFDASDKGQIAQVFAHNILITDNTVDSVPGAGIVVSQAKDVTITNNRVTHVGQHPFGVPLVDGKAVMVERTVGVGVSNNQVDAPVVLPDR